MIAKTFTEIIHKSLCLGPMNEIEKNLRNEIRDFLAHSVARYCHRHNSIKDHDILVRFVQELIKDLPADCGLNSERKLT